MKRFAIFFVALSLLFGATYTASASPLNELKCGDFLREMYTNIPEEIEFVKCKLRTDRQAEPLYAIYRVEGKHAANVEAFLIERMNMIPLKFICCLWESPSSTGVSYVNPQNGERYYLDMGTGETLESKRERWGDIPYFYIQVSVFTQEI